MDYRDYRPAEDDVILSDREEEEPEAPDLLGPCPEWCKGRPHLENSSPHPEDQSHDSEMVEFQVDVEAGPAELYALAELVWQPYAPTPERQQVFASTHWECESRRLGPADLLALAQGIEDYAARLRELSAQLAEIRAGELPDQGEMPVIPRGVEGNPGEFPGSQGVSGETENGETRGLMGNLGED